MKNKYHNEKYLPNQMLIDFFKENNTKEDFSILEIGCNEGYNLKAIHDIYPNSECFGIDIMKQAINSASEHFPEGHFFQADIEDMDDTIMYLMYQKFDYILLPDVLEHLTFPKGVMRFIVHYMLKPDGKVFINLPNLMNYSIMYDLIVNGNFTYTETGLLDSDHKHLFTLKEAKQMFQETGFKEIQNRAILLKEIFTQEEEDFIKYLLSAKNSVCEEIEFKTFTYMFILEKE